MAKSSTWEEFGVYPASNKTHNQNKKNTGYNNSLNEGLNFSTTLGDNFSTVAGGNFSTTGGLNGPVTLGGKVELISPWSIKWTKGSFLGYDYDFKNCETQVKWNEGQNIYTYNDKKITNYNYSPKDTGVSDNSEAFYVKAVHWCKDKLTSAAYESKKVVSGELKYGTMTTTVAGIYELSVGGEASGMQFEASGIGLGTIGTVLIQGDLAVSLVSNGKATVNGSIINVG